MLEDVWPCALMLQFVHEHCRELSLDEFESLAALGVQAQLSFPEYLPFAFVATLVFGFHLNG